ncbi:Putative alpha/Beta hydrolase [Septoria linicola]|uniref:Alpha/Beta hydrolase n=1 Tax=Septoria linicola TaxID=215465 RepID=A0A9Q9ASW3_9PEZI|nr:Putative alpha/Beta hydrolase [Septoria linicola]
MGHSMGASQAVAVATYHPRIFEALVLIDPAMTMTAGETIPAMIKYALSKPETFKSYEAAEKNVHKHPFFKRWHPAAKQKYIETAFHIEPTTLYPERDGTLKPKTSVFAETRGITRPNLQHAHVAKPPTTLQGYSIPDVDTSSPYTGPGYNPFSRQAYAWLGQLRPATQFILGKGSKVNPVSELEGRTNFTGSRVGGLGGVKAGNVKSVTVSGGHFLPMTNPEQTAEEAASWMAERIEKWRSAEKQFSGSFDQRDRAEKQALEPEVAKTFKNWDGKL